MSEQETLYVATRQKWRRWLKTNGQTRSHIWLVYYKKHTGQPSLPYDHAVEEAICFGWIDTTVRRIDEERYMQKFTPRRRKSGWSPTNRRRAEEMLAQGKVEAPGLACIDEAKANGNWEAALKDVRPGARAEIKMPEELNKALKRSKKARQFLASLPPGKRNQLLGWVGVAKKRETREKRAKEAVELLAQGRDLGMK
jgi:uncharacterized protein YdeI (YjbR/CyaY-like superfamily)